MSYGSGGSIKATPLSVPVQSAAYPTYASASLARASSVQCSAATIPALPATVAKPPSTSFQTSSSFATTLPESVSFAQPARTIAGPGLSTNVIGATPLPSVPALPTSALPLTTTPLTPSVTALSTSAVPLMATPITTASLPVASTLPVASSFTGSYTGGYNTYPQGAQIGGSYATLGSPYGSVIGPTVGQIGSQYGSVVGGYTTPYYGGPQILPNDHHEVEEAYRKSAEERDRELWKHLGYGSDEGNSAKVDDTAEASSGGIVGKVKDAVHKVEEKVEGVVHAVEDKVEGVVHAVHDKVSGFFGMIGGLFHKKDASGTGPSGSQVGTGSTVEVTKEDGTKARGHVVVHGDDTHEVYLHTDQPGVTTTFPASSVVHVQELAPVVGGGVEVLYEGQWYSGHVCELPMAGQQPYYKVQCHGDEIGQYTFADEASLRPLLSHEEKHVVAGHIQEVTAQQEAANAAAAAQAAASQKVADEQAKKFGFKSKFDAAGLTQFYTVVTEHGYDTEESLEHMHDDELSGFGMKPGHIAKFYQAFPRGTAYVLSNAELQATAPGVSYRSSKNIADDSHKVAAFGSVVQGTEQLDGWLKVGNLYLPMSVDGKKVIFPQGQEPKEDAGESGGIKEKVMDKVHDVEAKVSAGLHSFAHMLHFE